jgi:glycosyltransferase involved in cell wall biosynthesis
LAYTFHRRISLMPSITALVHTNNDVLRLGRCLETLYPCDEILVVDHASRDGTLRIAREYGARIIVAQPGMPWDRCLRFGSADWILALDPHESLTESLAASLFEWKTEWMPDRSDALAIPAFSLFLREETVDGWVDIPTAQTRLVPATWKRWNGALPLHQPAAIALHGQLLRFIVP